MCNYPALLSPIFSPSANWLILHGYIFQYFIIDENYLDTYIYHQHRFSFECNYNIGSVFCLSSRPHAINQPRTQKFCFQSAKMGIWVFN